MSAAREPEHIGKYRVLRWLGRGASSEVYLCNDPFNQRDVAVKRIVPEFLRSEPFAARYRKLFVTEASLAGRLAHPHIVSIYDAVAGGDGCYIVMEYVDGGTLEAYCSTHNLLPLERVVEIAFKCSRALAYAHGFGIIHRDIKPANILVSSPSDIKISDFGAALAASADSTQVTGIGSPAYMSPEQVREEELDQRTDIYSLGVVMYQLLTGALPYQAQSHFGVLYQVANHDPPPPSARRRDLPVALDKIVRRAMHKEPGKRYQSWDEFSRELSAAFRTEGASARKDAFGDTEKFEALRAMPFFAQFTDAELWQVVALASWDRFAASSAVMREGEPGGFFCLVVSGEMKVTRNKKLLGVLGPGECFGEMAYLLPQSARQRRATVAASADSRVLCIRTEELEDAPLACRHKFDRAFMVKLAERLNLANARLTSA